MTDFKITDGIRVASVTSQSKFLGNSIFEPRIFSNTKDLRKNTSDRLNEQALLRYVPYFRLGENYIQLLSARDDVSFELNNIGSIDFNAESSDFSALSDSERNIYESHINIRDMAIEKISALAGPLMTREINKLLQRSHLNADERIFDLLYYAGIGGLVKGLRHFNKKKIAKSATNYLFQWFTTYAEKELNVIEAPFGIKPSRFKKYKKISAVRKRISSEIERYATNDEVFEYFASGKADMHTMNGPVNKSVNPDGSGKFKSNQEITLELIEEQEFFESKLNQTANFDTQDEYASNVASSYDSDSSFGDTIFGVFIDMYNVTRVAEVVLISETSPSHISGEDQVFISEMNRSKYNSLKNRWRDLMRDKNGPFYSFLVDMKNDRLDISYGFDIEQIITNIENYDKSIKPERWLQLFENKKAERK